MSTHRNNQNLVDDSPHNYLNGNLGDSYLEIIKTITNNANKRIQQLLTELSNQGNLSFESFVVPIMDMEDEEHHYASLIFLFNAVNNTEQTVKLEDDARAIMIESSKQFYQNEDYLKAFTQISQNKNLTPAQTQIISDYLDGFRLNGMTASMQVRKRIKTIDLQTAQLESQFNQNVLKSVGEYSLTISDEMNREGVLGVMPESEKNIAKSTNENGETNYVFTLQAPSYIAFMNYCTRRDLREQIYKAFTNMGDGNETIIEQLLNLRHENAQLLGHKTYSELSLSMKSAKGTSTVFNYLYQLAGLAMEPARKELAVLQEYGATVGIPKLEPWDIPFISKKIQRETLDFDETKIRPFLEKTRILQGVFTLVQEMFGLRFEHVADAKLWHDKAEKYNIYRDKHLVGSIFLDLESRKGKRNGAWVQHWGSHFVDSNGHKHLPSVFLVCNFPPSTEGMASLLTHNDVTTLFHEMGHAVHHLLSSEPLRGVSGFNGVKWDLVEYPSQWLENFAYNPDTLQKIAQHHETDENISQDHINKLNALKNYNSALGMLRQLEFSIFDMEIHNTKPLSINEVKGVLASVREKTAVIEYPKFNNFQNSFLHIFAGGYSAGYYSYKWAETYAAETYLDTVDNAETLTGINPKRIKAFEQIVLAQLSGTDISETYTKFIGHPAPDTTCMLQLLGIQK